MKCLFLVKGSDLARITTVLCKVFGSHRRAAVKAFWDMTLLPVPAVV